MLIFLDFNFKEREIEALSLFGLFMMKEYVQSMISNLDFRYAAILSFSLKIVSFPILAKFPLKTF